MWFSIKNRKPHSFGEQIQKTPKAKKYIFHFFQIKLLHDFVIYRDQ
jgi:hypothetical protein